jgi:hypothetical protein
MVLGVMRQSLFPPSTGSPPTPGLRPFDLFFLAVQRRRCDAPIAIVAALVNFGFRLTNVGNHCDIAMRLRNVAMSLHPSPCLIPMAHDMML